MPIAMLTCCRFGYLRGPLAGSSILYWLFHTAVPRRSIGLRTDHISDSAKDMVEICRVLNVRPTLDCDTLCGTAAGANRVRLWFL